MFLAKHTFWRQAQSLAAAYFTLFETAAHKKQSKKNPENRSLLLTSHSAGNNASFRHEYHLSRTVTRPAGDKKLPNSSQKLTKTAKQSPTRDEFLSHASRREVLLPQTRRAMQNSNASTHPTIPADFIVCRSLMPQNNVPYKNYMTPLLFPIPGFNLQIIYSDDSATVLVSSYRSTQALNILHLR